MANTIALRKAYSTMLDEVYKLASLTAVLDGPNELVREGANANEILMPKRENHTAMYCGNGKEVEASINEKGTATGGKPGDQTGREFLIRNYRNYPWTHVLRYTKDGTTGNTNTQTGGKYMFEPKTVKKGDNGLSVLLLQEILIARGFKGKDGKPLTLDRAAGTNTIHALKKYQESRKGVLEADGICGDKTWRDLIAL